MTKDEVLQMCLEYIETNAHERRCVRWAIKDALAQPEQESTNWHVIDPTGNVVATEKDAIHGWARLGGFKPTLEVLLAHHESGWRVVPAPPLPVQPDQSVAGYCKKIGELIAERDRLRAALAQPVQPEQDFKTATKEDAPLVKWAKEQTPPLPVQPEQEPVAWEQFHEHMAGSFYTHPPQRTWVGLTDEEIADCAEKMEASDPTDSFWREFFRGIEAKLKEKNT